MATRGVGAATDRRYGRRIQLISNALNDGELALAEQYLGLLAETHSDDAEYLRLQAIAYDAHGRTAEAVATGRRAVASCPDSAACHNTLAGLLDHAYEFDAAVESAYRAVSLDAQFFTAWYNLSIVLAHAGRHQEAAVALKRAQTLEPENVAVRAKFAEELRDRGLVSKAEVAYRQIIHERPWSGVAWLGLAELKTSRFSTQDIGFMQNALVSPRATPDDRIAISYGLARALEDIGDYKGSLRLLASAKSNMRKRQPWNRAGFSHEVTSVLSAFGVTICGSNAYELGREVVFVVGLPRSGTTLVEQILASHHAVVGGGEIADLIAVISSESTRRGQRFPGWVGSMEPVDWERLGRHYLDRTANLRRHHAIFTDKLLSNWVFVGAIVAMLPSAHIVCCRRDPLETCFSNYRQYRARLEYSGSFSDVAAFWHDYDRAVRVWREAYPRNVFEHSYEGLLANPERSIRQLLLNCGLAWDKCCLQFWDTRRDVHTPSALQVREPLFRNASRSERYGRLLDPLRKCLNIE